MVTREDVISRLSQLGYTATEADYDALDFELNKIVNYTLNYCNIPTITDIPNILDPRTVDRVCSEFLFYKKNSGELENFNYDATIKSIKEGDTTLTYALGQEGDTPESRFDSMVKQLERGYDKWCTHYRRLRW